MVTLGGDTGSEARVSSSSGLWAHSWLPATPTASWVLLCWGQKPFSALLSWGLPAARRVPEGEKAESQPRTVMGPAVQGPDAVLTPYPAEGQFSGFFMGKSLLGLQRGQWGPGHHICPLSHHRPSQLPSQADTAGVAARLPASPLQLQPSTCPRIQPLFCPPQAQISPWCRPNTPWTTDHLGSKGLCHHLQ